MKTDSDDYTSVRFFFFQAEDGIRDLVRSRGLGDVYKRQTLFGKAARGAYDGVVAMYHDQGLIPLKLLAFGTLSLIHI